MQVEETEMKLSNTHKSNENHPKPGKGNAAKGYREEYNRYKGSKVHLKVM